MSRYSSGTRVGSPAAVCRPPSIARSSVWSASFSVARSAISARIAAICSWRAGPGGAARAVSVIASSSVASPSMRVARALSATTCAWASLAADPGVGGPASLTTHDSSSHHTISTLLILALCILPGCTRPPDAALYAEALSAGGLDQAQSACARIRDARLRGDCRVAALEAWEQADPAQCEAIDDGLWRDECTFLAAERLWSRQAHAEAVAACHQTRFSRHCVWHLLQDEAEAAADEAPASAEARMLPFLRVETRLPDAGKQFWALWFRLQARARRPVDGAACDGLIEEDRCGAGLEHYLHEVLSARRRAGSPVCDAPTGDGWARGPRLEASVARWVEHHCRR